MKCRHCNAQLIHNFLDLGFAPPSNSYLKAEDLRCPEKFFPLKVKICTLCWLVQTEDYAQAEELFNADYAYFSSTSKLWLEHAKKYVDQITAELSLNEKSLVIEVASNDGYLLKNFQVAGIPCIGIEPTTSTALAAKKLGITVIEDFFGNGFAKQLAKQGILADLIIGNNVFAHVPDVNDFALGLKAALKLSGTITLEFPHLMELLKYNQFDTVYHEHFSYFSLGAVNRIFNASGLRIWHVEQLSTHGGSLRIYGCHNSDARPTQVSVTQMLSVEKAQGLESLSTYLSFQAKADKVKNDLLKFLIEQKLSDKTVVAYGAAAKGNTLLNYAGVKVDLLPFVCDAAVAKQGKFMPASHIPIMPPEYLEAHQPDYVLILPWNIASEVRAQLNGLRERGVRFVTAVPELQIDPAV